MTGPADPVPPAESREPSPWRALAAWPLHGGMLAGVILLAAAAFAVSWLEGGASEPDRHQRAFAQAAIGLAAFAVLGFWGRRAVACTHPVERPVPWLRDPQDETGPLAAVATFAVVCAVWLGPLMLWVAVGRPLVRDPAIEWAGIALLGLVGAAALPLAVAGTVARGSALAALPGPVVRLGRAAPREARIAAVSALVFVALWVASFAAATWFNRRPPRISWEVPPGGVSDPAGDAVRVALAAMRAAGSYAALVSFRVAALLVRDVPAAKEAAS